MSPDESCGICGRSILAGERTRTYMSPKQGPKPVCELCRERARMLGWVDPTAPGANVGRAQPEAAREEPRSRLERAVARFNASEVARTVTGLTRSLGRPWASVGAAAGSPSEVRITVAWELCWYQWGIDLADESRPVFPIDKGSEVEQLDRPARQWNANVGEGGALALGAPAPGRAPDGEPVG